MATSSTIPTTFNLSSLSTKPIRSTMSVNTSPTQRRVVFSGLLKVTTTLTKPVVAKTVFWCNNNSRMGTSFDSQSPAIQELHVYELNQHDRGDPAYLRLSQKPVNAIGDLVPFSNKIYTGDMKKRAGISAGILVFIKTGVNKGDRYETIHSHYFGDYGHISMQGAYLTDKDTYLAITGGSGIFEGVYGQVKLHQITFPTFFFYSYELKGIPDLPTELLCEPVMPSPMVEPTMAARGCLPGETLPNFTD